jgi:iron(III) transport system substrate-binding protein
VTSRFWIIGFLTAALALQAGGAAAADLPKSTRAILDKAHFEASILDDLDDELKVPEAWLEAAKKEPDLRILASWDPAQFSAFAAPFRERYPNIRIQYSRGGTFERGIKTIMAYSDKRMLSDIVGSTSNAWIKLKEMNGLTRLDHMPNYKVLDSAMHDPDSFWIGQKFTYRCMAYNTTKIRKSDLPKTWDDLVTNPVWRNGNLGLPDVPDVWLAMLWTAKGPEWSTNFLTKLFNDVKPQLRKEGTSAVVSLTAAGEIPAVIGAADYRTAQLAKKGAPISWHCPEPIPAAVSQLMILKGSPATNRGLIFLNWFLSKEGQIAQYVTDYSLPVHKDLEKDPRFLPYPDEVIGKQMAVRDEVKMQTNYDKMIAVYAPLWTAAGGAPRAKEQREE